MKVFKMIASIISAGLLISCSSVGVGSVRKAVRVPESKYGMKYHFRLFMPQSLMGHDPVSVLRNKKITINSDVYTNKLGKVSGDQVIMDNRPVSKSVTFLFTNREIKIKNFQSCDNDGDCTIMHGVDGLYKIEK